MAAAPAQADPSECTVDGPVPLEADAGSGAAVERPARVDHARDAGHAPNVTIQDSMPPEAIVRPSSGIDRAAGAGDPVGSRLRAAREARGLTREALASLARIPLSAIDHIEADRLDAIGAPVYVRGFLKSYARAVGVPEVVVLSAIRDLEENEPPLVVANPASVGDRLAARYKNPMIYALLTLVVVVPLVFLATPKGQRAPEQAFAPLDAGPATTGRASVDVDANAAAASDGAPSDAPARAPALPPAPVMASMAPIASPFVASRPAGGRTLVLEVTEASWIELTTTDGRRLEWAQLPAGTVREYVVDGGADLVVGNVPGVKATLNGRVVDLNAVANRNVARLRVGDAEPASGQ